MVNMKAAAKAGEKAIRTMGTVLPRLAPLGKALAVITTSGYPVERGADIWEMGLRRTCKHAHLRWLGLYGERHRNYQTPFMDAEKAARARAFANELMACLTAEDAL